MRSGWAAAVPGTSMATITPAQSGQLSRGMRVTLEQNTLHAKELFLAVQSARVAAEPAAGPQHAVAGDDDRHRVGTQRVARRANGSGRAGPSGHVAIGAD